MPIPEPGSGTAAEAPGHAHPPAAAHVPVSQTLPAPAEPGSVLVAIARTAIARQLGLNGDCADTAATAATIDAADWLYELGASFVTLTQSGRLRGCLGTVEARRPLLDDVRGNAVAVAFRDRRFPPLTVGELDRTRVEVSVLSPLETILAGTRDGAIVALRPGIDGVVLEHCGRRATLLPQMWRTLPDPASFLAHLTAKAGLPQDFWDEEMTLRRYTVRVWREPDPAVVGAP